MTDEEGWFDWAFVDFFFGGGGQTTFGLFYVFIFHWLTLVSSIQFSEDYRLSQTNFHPRQVCCALPILIVIS